MSHNRIQQFASQAKPDDQQDDKLGMVVRTLRPVLEQMGGAVEHTIRKQPLAGVAVGLAIGVLVGCFIKRR